MIEAVHKSVMFDLGAQFMNNTQIFKIFLASGMGDPVIPMRSLVSLASTINSEINCKLTVHSVLQTSFCHNCI